MNPSDIVVLNDCDSNQICFYSKYVNYLRDCWFSKRKFLILCFRGKEPIKTNEHETNKKIDKKTRETAICFCKEIMSE